MIDRYLLSIDKEILSYHGKWCTSDDVEELERNQTPPIKEVCPECNGDGAFQFSQDPEDGCFCDKCKGSGEVYKYYTPEEYTAWMREHGQPEFELDDDCSIWLSNCDNGFVLASIGEQKGLASLGWIEQIFYICIPGQPAPPKEQI